MLEQVKELRTRTGCGMVDCKEALQEAEGDIEKAIVLLRKKGKAQAAKKAERPTSEGVITSYVHSNGKIGVLISLLCETDFVAKTETFQDLAKNIALHVAAMEPVAVSPEDIPEELIEAEQSVAAEQAAASGKPQEIQDKMIEGKMTKFKAERALLTQPFVKNPDQTISDLINAAVSELGENISVGEISRISI